MNMLKEHEKFWAFIVLVASIMGIAIISATADSVSEVQLRLLEKVNDGLLVVLGAAGLALFRTNENAKEMNDILKFAVTKAAEGTPPLSEGTPTDVPQDAADGARLAADAASDTADQLAEGKKP